MRAQPDLAVGPEERAREVLERALEVRQREARVDGEALDLLEHRRMRGVERVATVDAARADHVDRRRLRSITRTCTGEVCVRRHTPGPIQSVSDSAFDG